ncbi:LacI family transcriptional regulator [bacterium]|nr:MAG: LacI family transcriptional regulator [bacterium]
MGIIHLHIRIRNGKDYFSFLRIRMCNPMITAKDIARELNLSQPTVSRILNGDEGHRAAQATRERVWEAAQRLGYQPNAVARSLRRGRTDIIGVHTSHNYDVRNDFLGAIVGALQCACAERHLDVMLHSGLYGSRAETMYGKLRDGRVDGLILHSSAGDPLAELLRESSLPVVAVADALPGFAAVTCDDATGMKALVDLLWSRGHRKFAYLAPHANLPSVEKRRHVFESELQSRGVEAENRVIKRLDFENSAPVVAELRAQGPLAVCCWNDKTAYNLLHECLVQGVRVPQEMAVAGFDGLRDEKLPARVLATVRCPWDEVAMRALDVLVQLIESRGENGTADIVGEICLPVSVLDGDTI